MKEFEAVRNWKKIRGIRSSGNLTGSSGLQGPYQRVLQEVIEIHDSIVLEDWEEFQDAIGDTIVTLINLADIAGFKAEDCLKRAFDVIELRKGLIDPVRGDFVRYGKLSSEEKLICDEKQGNPGNEYFEPSALNTLEPKNFKHPKDKSTLPKLIITGYADHGKTTVGEILRDKYGFRMIDATDFIIDNILIPNGMYKTSEEAYENKFEDRQLWYEAVNVYNKDNPSRLCETLFESGSDLHVGMRNEIELQDAKAKLDVKVLWVQDNRKEPESSASCSVHSGMADYIIDNSGSLEDLEKEITKFMSTQEAE